MYGGS
jgi:hypothetical protein